MTTSENQGMSVEVYKAQITDLSKKMAALEKVRGICILTKCAIHTLQ